MASVASPGLGSGLDIGGIVAQLVAAEGAPLSGQLDRREVQLQAQLSALGSLKSALAELQTRVGKLRKSETFELRKASSSATGVFTATASGDAAPGQFELEVKSLATAHKLISKGYADAGATVGTGTLTISVGGESFVLSIDDANKTLAGVRDAINGAAANPGVTATLINVDDGSGGTQSKLVLTADDVGSGSAITVSVQDDAPGDADATGLSALAYDPANAAAQLSELRPAADAVLEIDGQAVTRPSNVVADAIDGVTIELAQADPGTVHTLSIDVDARDARGSIEGFVSAFNGLVDNLRQVTGFDAGSGRSGALFGDGAARGVETQLRRIVSDAVPGLNGAYRALVDLGIRTGDDGKLSIDDAKLDRAMSDDLEAVAGLFSGPSGFAARVDDVLERYLQSNGILDSRTDGLNQRIEDIGSQRDALERRLLSLEQRLQAQFSAMDSLVARLQSTSGFLSQQFTALQSLLDAGRER